MWSPYLFLMRTAKRLTPPPSEPGIHLSLIREAKRLTPPPPESGIHL
jgi:hypothetical protein